MTVALALLIKPFALLAVLTALLGIRFSIIRFVPDSAFKRLLLIRV